MALFLSLFKDHISTCLCLKTKCKHRNCAETGERMKSISKVLILSGVGIFMLICILIGVLYYRNLEQNESEMAVRITKDLEAYLNERVNEINPQFLEKKENQEKIEQAAQNILAELAKQLHMENLSWEELLQYFTEEQLTQLIDSVVNNSSVDWVSQFINKAGDTFLTQEEYTEISQQILDALREEIYLKLEEVTGKDRDYLLRLLQDLKENGDSQFVDLKALLKKLGEETANDLLAVNKTLDNTKLTAEQNFSEIKALKERLKTTDIGALELEKKHKEDMALTADTFSELSGELEHHAGLIANCSALCSQASALLDTRLNELQILTGNLSERTEACFQSVSSGKALLASTITDLGVTTPQDATFQLIAEKIKELYSFGFSSGVSEAIGNAHIEYIRHNHTGDNTSGGGCYTKENRHKHSNSKCSKTVFHTERIEITHAWGASGDLPTKCNTHGGAGNIGKFSHTDNWTCSDGTSGYRTWETEGWFCPQCEFQNYLTYTDVIPTCSYAPNQLLGYLPDCGYEEGEILQAVIHYEK